MFIRSIKASTLKMFACITVAVTITAFLIALTPKNNVISVLSPSGEIVYTDANDNIGRKKFLKQFGWELSENPISETEVTVPSKFDSVFSAYNELQKLQGLDISKYKHKKVIRYTYEVTNYTEYDGKVFANLIVYRGRVIGGDICTENRDGFIHGFSKDVHL